MKKSFKKWDSMSESEKAEAKKLQEERIKELENSIENGIKAVRNEENFKKYLKMQSKLHAYSLRNVLLVLDQAEERNASVSQLAGFTTWKKLNRYVKKGEKGYTILAPVPHKYSRTVQNDDGTEEEKTFSYNTYKPTVTFDVSQTDGDELPKICKQLYDDVENFDELINILISVAPCSVKFEYFEPSNAFGCYDVLNNCIKVQTNIGKAQAVKTLIHEIAHAIMHNLSVSGVENLTHAQKETQAEATAFIVSDYLGIDTSSYSFEYLAVFNRDENLEDFKKSLEIIQKCSSALIDRINKALEAEQEETKQIASSCLQIALF